jgi:hypothetical protein
VSTLSASLFMALDVTTGVIHLTYAPDADPPTGGYEQAKQVLADD